MSMGTLEKPSEAAGASSYLRLSTQMPACVTQVVFKEEPEIT
jgi:hypothetical protein